MKTHLLLYIIILLITSFNHALAQTAKKPNIVFIVVDDMSFDAPSVNGGQSYSTPNIDSMARHGKSFTHCESLPMCSPSRVMLLTGKQNFRNYCNWGFLSDTAKTLGNLMRNAGYNTGFFGKLELPCSAQKMQNWGWDQYTLFDMIDDTAKSGQRYKSPNLIDNNGRVADSIINNKYCDDILVSRLEDFIDQNSGNPFFIYYAMSLCHSPFSPTPDDPQYATYNAVTGKSDTAYFPSMVKYTDKKIGEILAKLRSNGLDTNTLVILTADNPTPEEIYYYANGKREQGSKTQTRESGTHVPLIAYMPGKIAPNTINDDLIDFTDFFPTFAGLAKCTASGLQQYGVLDGFSFYRRLFDLKGEAVRTNIFEHYDPHPGSDKDTLRRWVRDKNYKLYDSTTGSKIAGKFFNIITDPDEKKPIAAKNLTPTETALKSNFQHILDSTSNWLAGPLINNALASNITPTSVVLSATVISSGASALKERGTNISPQDNAFYYDNNLKDSIVQLGAFAQTRTGLLSQKKYYYSGYAMNKNESNNTAYVSGSFYTLATPPLKQPLSLTANNAVCTTVTVSWNNAVFPTKGANKGGYLLFYSADSIVLNRNANGKSPLFVTANPATRNINLKAKLPTLPPTTATINNLSPDTLYHFMLVPYTYDGSADETCNYLTDSARTINNRPRRCTMFAVAKSEISSLLYSSITINPNPSSSFFTLHTNTVFLNKTITIRVSDVAGKVYINTTIAGNQYAFGERLQPGVYIVTVTAGDSNYAFNIIKE